MTECVYTDEQIIDALEVRMPHDEVCRAAYDLIKKLKAEIEQLKMNLAQCENGYSLELHNARFEIERLQAEIKHLEGHREADIKAVQSMKAALDEKRYYSPQDVRKMTPKEIHENYSAIMESMKKWK